ncbi:MAG: PQQ-binding-like beta-propeller repeat protein, partial [bacterium]|nr:PQQ-binding-like beta-propeller repeat protein [bacterium]
MVALFPMMDNETHPTHVLMPGIRCAEINSTAWPRTLHDKQLTGFSPLGLGMSDAPAVWQTIDVPGQYDWLRTVDAPSGPCFLIDDGRLSLYAVASGQLCWRADISGHLLYWGDLFGDGDAVALLRRANRLFIVDGTDGRLRWSRTYDPPHVDLRVQVARVLADTPGQQAVVFEQYGESGALLCFEPGDVVREVWRRQVISNDVWPVRADHGCDIALDLTGDSPIVWNVRHHRCQSFDACTGAPLGCLEYELEGAFRRNYGPWRIATGAGGQRAIAVASEMVQTHVHGLRLHADGTPELAWDRYYGEVYVVPGVAVEFLGVSDVDGDGADEILYNVRDPEQGFRSFVRARDVATGEIKHELGDRWCSALVGNVGAGGTTLLLIHPAPEGATPGQGPLQLVELGAAGASFRHAFDHGGPWGMTALPGEGGGDLLLRVIDADGTALVRLDGDTLAEVERVTGGPLLTSSIGACARTTDGALWLATGAGSCRWPAGDLTPFDLAGGAPPTLSAADRAPDGAIRDRVGPSRIEPGPAELVAHVPGGRVQSWRLSGSQPEQILDEPFLGATARHSPLLYDLDGDGALELVIPGATDQGQLTARAVRSDGSELWHIVLPRGRTDDGGKAVAWNAGQFLAAPGGTGAAVALSVYSLRRTLEGTFLLDGATGRALWFLDHYHDGDVIRGYLPVGLPGAFDWDGDGAEEIAWDMYSYMAFLRGDGSMAAIFGGPNVRPESEAVPAISLYNGFTPIYRGTDEHPHWLIHHGHGRFGFVGPDPRQGIWHEDEGYDTPDRIGFIDVDGDGGLEVGYALRNSTTFCCRDVWT